MKITWCLPKSKWLGRSMLLVLPLYGYCFVTFWLRERKTQTVRVPPPANHEALWPSMLLPVPTSTKQMPSLFQLDVVTSPKGDLAAPLPLDASSARGSVVVITVPNGLPGQIPLTFNLRAIIPMNDHANTASPNEQNPTGITHFRFERHSNTNNHSESSSSSSSSNSLVSMSGCRGWFFLCGGAAGACHNRPVNDIPSCSAFEYGPNKVTVTA